MHQYLNTQVILLGFHQDKKFSKILVLFLLGIILLLPRPDKPKKLNRKYKLTFPNLIRMARDILRIMLPSETGKRLFSNADNILQPERCYLKNDTLKMLLFMESWMPDPIEIEKLIFSICRK